MCGRYALTSSANDLSETFGVDARANIPMRYNIAPTQPVLIVRHGDKHQKELAAVEWGLVPEWSKQGRGNTPLINARIETITEKPSFRGPIKRNRCLVPANAWYEWKGEQGIKRPWLVEPHDKALMAFAGIWTTWHGPSGDHWLETMAIITAPALGPLKAVHHRRPLVVDSKDYHLWLTATDPLPRNFLKNISFIEDHHFTMRRVSTYVNSVRHDDVGCIARPEEDPQTLLF